jgi:hypothetical protein
LHALPRTIAFLGSYLDPIIQPAFFVACSLGVTICVVKECTSLRHSLPLKPLLALCVVLVPHTGEVFFNPTNLQWVAALGLLLVSVKSDPLRTREWIGDFGWLIWGGLSGPFSIFAVPLFVARFLTRRTRASGILLGACVTVAVIQLVCVFHSPKDTEFVGPFSFGNLVTIVGFRWGFGVVFGPLFNGIAVKWLVVGGGWVIMGVGIFGAVTSTARRPAMYLVAFALALVTATALRKRFDLWLFGDYLNGDRYWYLPKVILLWCLVISISNCRRFARYGAATLLALCMVGCVREFFLQPYRRYDWYQKCDDIRHLRPTDVTVNPDWKFRYQRSRKVIFARPTSP